MTRLPFRSPRATTTRTDTLTAALADLEAARSVERAVRTLVAERKEGASALSTAEYRLHCALNRVQSLGGMKPPEPVAESDDDYGPDAA